MKTYSTKAAAKKGAKRQELDMTSLEFLQNDEDRWYWQEPQSEDKVELKPAHGDEFGVQPGKGIKIEKDRQEQNGITKPSIGGKCRAIWDACDLEYASNNVPAVKRIKEIAVENGWNVNNAVIEYYQWRKFHGLTGRQN